MNEPDFNHKEGEIVKVTITSSTSFGAFAKLEDGETGLIHISEIDNCYIKDVANALPIGSIHDVMIISTGNKPHTYKLSVRRALPQRRPRQINPIAKKPLTRRQTNIGILNRLSFKPLQDSLSQMTEAEYKRIKGENTHG